MKIRHFFLYLRFLRSRFLHFSAAALLIPAAWAQVGAPVLGYVPSGGYLLPVNGIAAAASVGLSGGFRGQFIRAVVSPHQDFALISSAADGAVMLAYPSGTTTPIAGVPAYPDSITLSPSGSAAVLWFASTRTIAILSGLPGSPKAQAVDTSFLSGASTDVPVALGVSDDGAWGAGAWRSGVWAFSPGSPARSLLSGDLAYALAFYPGQDNLAIATRSGIYGVTGIGGSATVATLYSAQNFGTPAGLTVLSDTQTIVMANRAGTVLTVNPATGASTQTDCECAPQGIFPMLGSAFRITNLSGSIFKIFDASSGSVFTVPLAAAAGGSQ